ncbi:hypothetical protein MTO96_041208 [Rhipicephalus appendiculatus]
MSASLPDKKEDTMDDVASTLGKHNLPCFPASPADKQTLVGADALTASLIPAADCAVVSDIPKSDAGVSSDEVSKPNEPNTPVPSESQARDFLEQVARRHGNSLLTRLDKQPAVKVVGGTVEEASPHVMWRCLPREKLSVRTRLAPARTAPRIAGPSPSSRRNLDPPSRGPKCVV